MTSVRKLPTIVTATGVDMRRFPPWMKRRIPCGAGVRLVTEALEELNLQTVCKNARCPNITECFSRGTATLMIMGNICTRSCRFCAVEKGRPLALDDGEPVRVARAARRLGLRHVVVTSVTRDDLPDGGAEHFARTVEEIRKVTEATVEVLTPDFRGGRDAIEKVIRARPEVFNHNVETVPRLYEEVRPGADYARSLSLLEFVKENAPGIRTKSGIMVGLGESHEEVVNVMSDLMGVGCDVLTIGQYLAPSEMHLAIARFVPPEEFEEYERVGMMMGFEAVFAGPYVRSSYRAEEVMLGAKGLTAETTQRF